MEWVLVERPGYSGKKRDEKHRNWDEKYGEDNWRISWTFNDQIITKEVAYQLYEDGYYHDSFNRQDLWLELTKTAKDVYDLEPRDAESGLDYLIQKGNATHLQDISIRRVILRRGWRFKGDELVRIRGHKTYWGKNLSPGKVPFHLPRLIIEPHLESWWNLNSVEDFYQSNKILEIKKE